jgi:signal peptidase
MRIIRLLGNIALWIGAVLGILAGGVWLAGQMGWVQPLIVISGSMEPGIHTGDLLLDRNVATADLAVGDVASLHSEMTGKLVTHRVVSVTPAGDSWEITLKGDANDNADTETYVVGDSVLQPFLRIPMGGTVVSKLMEPAVALPILLALVALLGMSLLDEEPRRTVVVRNSDENEDDHEVNDDPVVVRTRRDPLDDLDEALAALGIDVRAFDPDEAWPDDAGPDNDPADADEHELVMSG